MIQVWPAAMARGERVDNTSFVASGLAWKPINAMNSPRLARAVPSCPAAASRPMPAVNWTTPLTANSPPLAGSAASAAKPVFSASNPPSANSANPVQPSMAAASITD